jgi:putative Mg2+ transporter-C (MgtC) family protein
MEFSDLFWTFALRVGVAALLGISIGIERDWSGRAAGIRTSMLVSISSCLFTILSAYGFADAPGTPDPTRIASQIVSGVGFLGAGALIHKGSRVLGLTTAADVWFAAAAGMAAGAGFLLLGAAVTAFSIFLLLLLAPISHVLEKVGNERMRKKGLEVVEEK